ncbi:hypothetical protein [Aromatoleum buckelii]|uniref:Uncharacterized protein n=1 Tax=Aromatoleum buckelii TaxID=200254 RepID=A0ABX1N1H6_9RHOO|nr:hypothetical protein [Aromatoleum buckelii]MCK0510579.1 hypothetical protein [Aromatoleum buckelii]
MHLRTLGTAIAAALLALAAAQTSAQTSPQAPPQVTLPPVTDHAGVTPSVNGLNQPAAARALQATATYRF